MRRRKKAQEDSLDLLLDTMCNAFGGIVFIAILVALLISPEGSVPPAPIPSPPDKTQMEKLKNLEARVEEIRPELTKIGEVVQLIIKRDVLAAALENIRKSGFTTLIENQRQLNQMIAENDAATRQAAETSEQIAALTIEKQNLIRQIEEMERQTKDLIASRKREMRPPKVKESVGQQLNFVVRYGEFYPVQTIKFDAQGNMQEIQKNEQSLDWTADGVQPKKGQGLDQQSILNLLQGVKRYNQLNASDPAKQYYVIAFAYQDSFETLLPFQKAVESVGGIKSGWEPIGEKITLNFGPGGTTSGTQN